MADVQPLHRLQPSGAIAFGRDFMSSDAFRSLFREGMALVEEAAAYLDGPGRDEARRLPRLSALAYADESMRLTTRMMQIASWLLVRRAVAEGEMSKDKASLQMARIRLVKNEHATHGSDTTVLPRRLIDLINQSSQSFLFSHHYYDLFSSLLGCRRLHQPPMSTSIVTKTCCREFPRRLVWQFVP
jgi:regulator of CtrA degradation